MNEDDLLRVSQTMEINYKAQSMYVLLSSDNCPSAITAMCSSSSTFFLSASAITVLPSSSRFFFFLPLPSVFYDLLPDFFSFMPQPSMFYSLPPDFFPFCLNHQCFMRFVSIFLKK
jgi:hypothetical protein